MTTRAEFMVNLLNISDVTRMGSDCRYDSECISLSVSLILV